MTFLQDHIKQNNKRLSGFCLLVATMIYKIALDASFFLIQMEMPPGGYWYIPLWKAVIGLIWCLIFFVSIRHTLHRASSFFLYLTYMVQIIPLTTVYVMEDESSVFYFSICIGFLLCIFLVNHVKDPEIHIESETFSRLTLPFFVILTVLLMIHIYLRNGPPQSIYLSFDDVYELRGSGWFQIGKYFNYIMDYARLVFIPFCIAVSIRRGNHFAVLPLSGILVLLYLYSGNKIILFSVPLVIICTYWAKRENACHEVFIALSLLCILTAAGNYDYYLAKNKSSFLLHGMYELIIRRCLFVPARLKFYYYDFFCKNPHIGLSGIFPTWLVPVKNPYPVTSVPFLIGAQYFNAPRMHADTGFLAEGFERFGHIGTLLEFLVLAFLLKQMDHFQNRHDYMLTIGLFVFPVYALTEGQLLSSLVLGSWMWIVFILLFYKNQDKQYVKEKNAMKMKLSTPPP